MLYKHTGSKFYDVEYYMGVITHIVSDTLGEALKMLSPRDCQQCHPVSLTLR